MESDVAKVANGVYKCFYSVACERGPRPQTFRTNRQSPLWGAVSEEELQLIIQKLSAKKSNDLNLI